MHAPTFRPLIPWLRSVTHHYHWGVFCWALFGVFTPLYLARFRGLDGLRATDKRTTEYRLKRGDDEAVEVQANAVLGVCVRVGKLVWGRHLVSVRWVSFIELTRLELRVKS